MNSLEFREGITETLDILNHMDKSYTDKIPKKFKDFLEKNKISFDKDIWYGEGMLFNILCLQYTDNVIVGNKKVYHQTWNPSSAMRNFNLESNYCGIKSMYLQKKLWETKSDVADVKIAWEYHLRCFNRSILVGIIKTHTQKLYCEEYKKCIKELKRNLLVFLKAKISLKRKVYYFCMAICPVLIASLAVTKERKFNEKYKIK